VIGLTVALVILAAAAVVLSVLFVRTFHQKQQLLRELQATHATFRDLRDQKDVLMARLVAIQSRPGGLDGSAEGARAGAPPEKTTASAPETAPTDAPGVAVPAVPAPAPAPPPLAVRDFSVTPEADSRGLKIRFKLMNTGGSGVPVAGYSFVFLKPGGGVAPDRWRVLPDTPLAADMPADVQQGQYFSIAHHIYQTFRVEGVDAPDRYTTATVAVFEKSGRILVRRDFDLNLAAWPVSPPAAGDRVKSAADPSPQPAGLGPAGLGWAMRPTRWSMAFARHPQGASGWGRQWKTARSG
jgi:hypothetical protein